MKNYRSGIFVLQNATRGALIGQLAYMIATAGRICVAEAEEIVEIGALDADHIHTPGIFVKRLVHNPHPEKRIEQRTVKKAS